MVFTIRKKKEREQDWRRRVELNHEEVSRTRLKENTWNETTTTDHDHQSLLPPILVLYDIVSKLPIKSLLRFRCVSKLWCNVIDHDPNFCCAQFIHSRKNPILMFNFYDIEYDLCLSDYHYFYLEKKEDALVISTETKDGGVELGSLVSFREYDPVGDSYSVLVGSYNGLDCLCVVSDDRCFFRIFNPSRRQVLDIVPLIGVEFNSIKGYGFGFDSITKKFKVVCIIDTKESEYNCLVYTLGSNDSWRKVPGPGYTLGSNDSWRKVPGPGYFEVESSIYGKPGVSCDGALYFTSPEHCFEILSFDLHSENFKVIEIPVEGIPIPFDYKCQKFQLNADCKNPIIWFHHLEYKGCLSFVTLEELDGQECKVNFFTLENKTKRVWIKDTFFVPFPCDFSTRIVCFSDQALLYWFYAECFLFYDLHTKVSNIVKFPRDYFPKRKYLDAIRRSKERADYQIYTHVANSICLRNLGSLGAITKQCIN